MSLMIICLVLLGPQVFAAVRGVGPAGVLSLFVLCVVGVIGFWVTIALIAMQAAGALESAAYQQDTYYVVHLSLLGFATFGLVVLTPLYWVVEWRHPQGDMRLDIALVQGVVLLMTAAIVFAMGSNAPPGGGDAPSAVLVEGAALGMICLSAARAAWHLLQEPER